MPNKILKFKGFWLFIRKGRPGPEVEGAYEMNKKETFLQLCNVIKNIPNSVNKATLAHNLYVCVELYICPNKFW